MTIIDKLTLLLQQRREAPPDDSYVASLYDSGLNKILEKLGEEATETLLAAKDVSLSSRETPSTHVTATSEASPEYPKDDALIGEVADLWFHSLVMLVYLNQEPRWVLEELERRFGTSGLVEKAARGDPDRP